MSLSFKKNTTKGFLWNSVNQFGNQGANFIFSIVLARLLGPEEYGLIAMVTIFTSLLGVITNFGFGLAAIQRDNTSNNEWSTLFFLNFLFGIFSASTLFFFSTSIGKFYDKEILVGISKFLAIGLILSPLSIVPKTKLIKKIDYKSISIATIISTTLSGAVGVLLALNDFGVYSLVYQRILNYLLNLIGLWVFNKFWIPSLTFSIAFIKEIFSFSFYTFLSGILSFATRNTDNLLIGKFIGDKELGEYNRAYSFLMFPINMISRVITSVLFPSYSQIKTDLKKISSSFISISLITAFTTIPIMSVFFLSAHEIVLIIFGKQWISIAYLIKLFCLIGVYQSVLSLNGPIYIALGYVKLDLKISLFTEVIIISSILIGVRWGVEGVITSLYVAALINFFPSNYFILKKIGLSIVSYYSIFIKNIILSSTIIIVVYFSFQQVPFENIFLLFTLKSLLFTILYLLTHIFLKTKELKLLIKYKPF